MTKPKIIDDETNEYFSEQDIISLWLTDCCNVNLTAKASNKQVYQSYRTYCENIGQPPKQQASFSQALSKLGFEPYKFGSTIGLRGFSIKPNFSDPAF